MNASPMQSAEPTPTGYNTLLAAIGAVASGLHDKSHGWDAARNPRQFAQAVMHDLDPLVPLPEGSRT